MDLLLIAFVFAALLAGYPVALSLAGVSVVFALMAFCFGQFDLFYLQALPSRLFGLVTNPILMSIPMFVAMGVVLEKTGLAADMVRAAARLFEGRRAGLPLSVVLLGTVLGASSGMVGASVVTLGLIALPTLLKRGWEPGFSSGLVAASGTMGQIIPPSIALIVLSDQISNAYQVAQTRSGQFASETVTVTDLFAAALLPGLLTAGLFAAHVWWRAGRFEASTATGSEIPIAASETEGVEDWTTKDLVAAFVPPLVLIVLVLGSILFGLATAGEAASVGTVGALVLAAKRLDFSRVQEILFESVQLIGMIFFIIVGASIFSLVFRGLGGEQSVSALFSALPDNPIFALLVVMAIVFVLGFFLEFLEITFIVVPLVAPVLLMMPYGDTGGMSPIWLAILFGLVLQTSFLTPPFGLSLFYLRSVAPKLVTTGVIYRGVVPFILLQILVFVAVLVVPEMATALPRLMFGG